MKLIALTGSKGCGKDTVGLYMKELFADEAKTIAFADPIKLVVMDLFGLKDTDEYDKFKRTFVTYQLPDCFSKQVQGRHLVREIGMLMRGYDEQQFVEYIKSTLLKEKDKIWVITDLRFENERQMVKELGGVVVKVPNEKKYSADTHITEKGFSSNNIDYILPNHGTTDMLLINLKSLLKELKQTNETWSNIQFF